MDSQKADNMLNLAVDTTPEEREKSLELDVGYDEITKEWELIIKYSGDIQALEEKALQVTPLLSQYAIVRLRQQDLDAFLRLPQVEYAEKPKRLYFADYQAMTASCIPPLWQSPFDLRGRGILVGCVDSGIDYSHPDFCHPDGTTRILRLWDQTIDGNPPQGYAIGTEYTKEDIDRALMMTDPVDRARVLPSRDTSGHGTAVMGIAAGNGSSGGLAYQGVANESDLLVVKMGVSGPDSFPRTTELMMGIDYCIRQAMAFGRPLALNLSFGNSYGSHEGNSLVETYLNQMAQTGRNVICVGMGNEGAERGHTTALLTADSELVVELSVGQRQTGFNIQIWKSYVDDIRLELIAPSGSSTQIISPLSEPGRYRLDNTMILVYYGYPSPYSRAQEIYLDLLPVNTYVDFGIWQIRLISGKIVSGTVDLWLPGGQALNQDTIFYRSTPDRTLTIPAAASEVISVGAYDSNLRTYADFSGRGYTRVTNQVKPDLAAPGVNITTTRSGGGYTSVTGTSFATPFVTGSAALLMEWGIVQGNDLYLYNQKVKAYLIAGARQLPAEREYPNPRIGWGVLCARDSLPV